MDNHYPPLPKRKPNNFSPKNVYRLSVCCQRGVRAYHWSLQSQKSSMMFEKFLTNLTSKIFEIPKINSIHRSAVIPTKGFVLRLLFMMSADKRQRFLNNPWYFT